MLALGDKGDGREGLHCEHIPEGRGGESCVSLVVSIFHMGQAQPLSAQKDRSTKRGLKAEIPRARKERQGKGPTGS